MRHRHQPDSKGVAETLKKALQGQLKKIEEEIRGAEKRIEQLRVERKLHRSNAEEGEKREEILDKLDQEVYGLRTRKKAYGRISQTVKMLGDLEYPKVRPFSRLKEAAEETERKRGQHPSEAEMRLSQAATLADWLILYDAMAVKSQITARRLHLLLCAIATTFLVCFELFAHAPGLHLKGGVLLLGNLILLIGFGISRWEKWAKLFRLSGLPRDTQLDYLYLRTTAEILRVAIVWRANGIFTHPLEEIADRHYSGLRFVVEFLRPPLEDLREKRPVVTESFRDPGLATIVRKLTVEEWVLDQRRYFVKAYAEQHCFADGWQTASTHLFGYGVVACIALVAVSFVHHEMGLHHLVTSVLNDDAWEFLNDILLTLAPSFIVLGAITEFHSDRSGFSSQAHRYRNAYKIFERDREGWWWSSLAKSYDSVRVRQRIHSLQEAVYRRPAIRITMLLCDTAALGGLLAFTLASLGHPRSHISAQSLIPLGIIFAGIAGYFGLLIMRTLECRDLAQVKADEIAKHLSREQRGNGGLDDTKWEGPCDRTELEEWNEMLAVVGRDAIDELIEWFVSSHDREIALPKG